MFSSFHTLFNVSKFDEIILSKGFSPKFVWNVCIQYLSKSAKQILKVDNTQSSSRLSTKIKKTFELLPKTSTIGSCFSTWTHFLHTLLERSIWHTFAFPMGKNRRQPIEAWKGLGNCCSKLTTRAKNYKRNTMGRANEVGWWEEADWQPEKSRRQCEVDEESALSRWIRKQLE